jgi:hypothetical protein
MSGDYHVTAYIVRAFIDGSIDATAFETCVRAVIADDAAASAVIGLCRTVRRELSEISTNLNARLVKLEDRMDPVVQQTEK